MTTQTQLAAEKLKNDPRLAEAKKLILEAVAEHQQEIVSVRPPEPSLAEDFNSMLGTFGEMRGAATFFPFLGSGIGNGPFVEIADGSVKLDMILSLIHI